MMFASTSPPPLVSLFSSTSSDALALFSTHTDPLLPADSFVHFLTDATSAPPPAAPAVLVVPHPLPSSAQDTSRGYELTQTVLHIQSPTLRTMYVRCPPEGGAGLGLRHAWLHLQVRGLGTGREWAVEVGIVDTVGRAGIVRCSTFQMRPALKRTPGAPPLLHLPLAFPTARSTPLTSWATLSLHLPSLLSHFAALATAASDEHAPQPQLPGGRYAHADYVKVYASCRLRRVWFSERAEREGAAMPWEMQLYAES